MKWYLLLLIFSAVQNVSAQVDPFEVYVQEADSLPAIYPLAESHFDFQSAEAIDSVIVSDSAKWEVIQNDLGHYVVKCRAYSRSQPVDFDSTLNVELWFANGASKILIAPIVIYAEVKVRPYGKNLENHNDSTLPCGESIGFHATWVYPDYVKKRWRVYGVFEIDVMLNDERIDGFSGWYDSGDRSKMRDFSRYPIEAEIKVRVRPNRLKTLHRFEQNGARQPVVLSKEYPNVWTVECDS